MHLTQTAVIASLLLLVGCPGGGGGEDLTSTIVGTYEGSMVIDLTAVVDANYSVDLARVDGDTISVSGADFTTFEVDLMGDGDSLTSLAGDEANSLSFATPDLSFSHTGDESVEFAGALQGSGDDDDAGARN